MNVLLVCYIHSIYIIYTNYVHAYMLRTHCMHHVKLNNNKDIMKEATKNDDIDKNLNTF